MDSEACALRRILSANAVRLRGEMTTARVRYPAANDFAAASPTVAEIAVTAAPHDTSVNAAGRATIPVDNHKPNRSIPSDNDWQ
jgi:hypothetical protein